MQLEEQLVLKMLVVDLYNLQLFFLRKFQICLTTKKGIVDFLKHEESNYDMQQYLGVEKYF